MKNLTIQIPDMQSAHCRMRVTTAIKNLNGVLEVLTEAGTAKVGMMDEIDPTYITNGIEAAGYRVAAIIPEKKADKTFIYRTNINCSGCLATVARAFDAVSGICHWDVDLQHKERILSVHSDGITNEEIIETVQNAGFKIEPVNN